MRSSAATQPLETADRETLSAWQTQRLGQLLIDIHGRNAFYTRKLDGAGIHAVGACRRCAGPKTSRGCR